jgi:hypothetical protein
MKRTVSLAVLVVVMMGAGFLCARHHARVQADVYMRSVLDRGWRTGHARFGIGGGTCGWVFYYELPDEWNCFPPFVTVTWRGQVRVKSSSDPKWYASRYDAWRAEHDASATEIKTNGNAEAHNGAYRR